MRTTLRRLLASRIARIAATLILLGLVLWKSQPQRIVPAAGTLGLGSLLFAATLTIPFLYLKSLRWLYMLRYAGSDATFGEAARSLIGGMGIALLTPARLGELARVAYLRDPRKLRLGGLVLLDKVFDVVVLALLSSVGAWQIIGPLPGAALLLVGCAGLLFLYMPGPFGRFIGLSGGLERDTAGAMVHRLRQVWSALDTLTLSSTTLYLALTAASFVVVIAQFGIILHDPHSTAVAHLSLRVALLTFPLVILTNVLPLTIGGLGIREGTAALLLSHFHVGTAIAVVAAFMMFFLNTALPGILGALVLPFTKSVHTGNGRIDPARSAADSSPSAHGTNSGWRPTKQRADRPQ